MGQRKRISCCCCCCYLERRVVGSFMTMTSVTSPCLLKYSRSPSADVCQLRPPINIFLFGLKKKQEEEFIKKTSSLSIAPRVNSLKDDFIMLRGAFQSSLTRSIKMHTHTSNLSFHMPWATKPVFLFDFHSKFQ